MYEVKIILLVIAYNNACKCNTLWFNVLQVLFFVQKYGLNTYCVFVILTILEGPINKAVDLQDTKFLSLFSLTNVHY